MQRDKFWQNGGFIWQNGAFDKAVLIGLIALICLLDVVIVIDRGYRGSVRKPAVTSHLDKKAFEQ